MVRDDAKSRGLGDLQKPFLLQPIIYIYLVVCTKLRYYEFSIKYGFMTKSTLNINSINIIGCELNHTDR